MFPSKFQCMSNNNITMATACLFIIFPSIFIPIPIVSYIKRKCPSY